MLPSIYKCNNVAKKILEEQTVDILRPYQVHLHTITADDDKEFTTHQKIAQQLDVKFYFAKPYHP